MSGGERHTVPVDVHLIAVREGEKGVEVLLSRRAGTVYAAGHWHFPSGHVDGPFEDVVTALVREAYEETGLVVDPVDVRAAVTIHHRAPAGSARVGFFFEVRRWSGTPQVMEPGVCDAMDWFAFDALPEPMVAYCRAGLDAYALPLGKVERHLNGARAHLTFGDEDFIRTTVEEATGLPALDVVPTHGDLQLRNLRWDEAADVLYVIDFERSEEGPAIRDFARLSDAWHGRPDLLAAVTEGYGRPFTPDEEAHLTVLSVLDAVSGISYGAAHHDPELVERGRRALARLRTAQRP